MKQTFFRDLRRGKQIESMALEKIKSKYPNSYIVDGYFKDWDIFIPELNLGVEVKSDEKSKYTGNIVIEIEFNNKPSALSTTKAHYWMFWDGYSFNTLRPSMIWRCIEDNKLNPVKFIGKGDVKQKKAYLIKKDLLYKYCENA
ncbi:MAG: hypothetical protein Unbinned5089contig1000_32 [Prokaryotic dsDNA virus sp.]|nr:MAG: hypothetical protein Unbinned5089contig1000_32 [Prokaryotic dsDNA virus sp.]